jgi:uncharacterized protein
MVNAAIPADMHAEILRRLRAAEDQHQVKILYCVESGSRAWGFFSPDSDFDVRFLYAHKPERYLSFDVEARRDVIEYPIIDEIDCNGWDLRKALYLFTRTNGALLEWLNSPICYIEEGGLAQQLRELAPQAINSIALCYHYSHMARNNAREYLRDGQVKLKKYFYILRPLLAIRYIEQDLGVPPVEFANLVSAVAPQEIHAPIGELLDLKINSPEVAFGPPLPSLNKFIDQEIERHGDRFHGQGRPDILDGNRVRDQLNEIFRSTLAEAFPNP